MSEPAPYIGRFAPSPTGPLHFGSLLAAIASYLEARRQHGRWLVRIEDMDPPRERADAPGLIVAALERYGFEWDGEVTMQSVSDPDHRVALSRLVDAGLAYPCGCSRRDLAEVARGPLGTIYPGTCRNGTDALETAIRLRTDDDPVEFDDRLQGRQSQQLQSETGDFVILRRDGLIAYHLAVVVDDHLQGITEIVRGIDLMDSTPRQILLQRLLGFHTPAYAHIPVAVHPDGNKLSKLTGAAPLPLERVRRVLCRALAALGQSPPADLASNSLDDVWHWAKSNWRIDALAGVHDVAADEKVLANSENRIR